MIILRVDEITKEYFQAQNERVLVVALSILDSNEDEEKLLDERKLAFSLETDHEQLKAELDKFLTNWKLELEQKASNEELDKKEVKSDKLIKDLTGLELGKDE